MKTLSIYEAKTNFSKIVNKAKNGQVVYVGAFGKPEVMIVPLSKKAPVVFGLAKNNLAYKNDELVGADEDVQTLFYGEDS